MGLLDWFRARSRWAQAGIVLGILFVVLIVVAAVAGEDEERSVRADQPTQTVEPRDAAPTAEPDRDSTPMPEPTLDPEAIAEAVYAIQAQEMFASVADALSEAGGLLQNPRLFDNEWRRDLVVPLAILSLAADQWRDIQPPAKFREFHDKVQESFDYMEAATHELAEGIDELSAARIDNATSLLLEGSALLVEANALLTDLLAE